MACHSDKGRALIAEGVDELCRKAAYAGGREAALRELRAKFANFLGGRPLPAVGINDVTVMVAMMITHVLACEKARKKVLIADALRDSGVRQEDLPDEIRALLAKLDDDDTK